MLVDTSALYALLDSDQEDHTAATGFFRGLSPEEELVMPEYVLVEMAALVQARLGRGAVQAFCLDLMPRLTIRQLAPAGRQAAIASFLAGPARVSFVDWSSFEIMRSDGIHRAFAFDDDFRKHGFITVP